MTSRARPALAIPETAKRRLKPRQPMVVRPSFVSNETCLTVLGLVPRKFLEVVVPRCRDVTRVGRTVLVDLDEAERVVRDLGDTANDAATTEDTRQPTTEAEVLAELGLERAS
jgi:hypothetical protein